jgi:hypothetical protein
MGMESQGEIRYENTRLTKMAARPSSYKTDGAPVHGLLEPPRSSGSSNEATSHTSHEVTSSRASSEVPPSTDGR